MNKTRFNNILKYFEAKDYEIQIFRIWISIVGFFIPVYGWFLIYFLPESFDRLDHRLMITAMSAAVVIASYFINL